MDNYVAGHTLAERATSGFPLAIGTSLAFESVFPAQQAPYDPSRKIPTQVDLAKYQHCWINVSTLFRNLSSAVSKEAFLGATPQQLADTLLEEIDVIQQLFQIEGRNSCTPKFFYSDYSTLLRRKVPGLSFREPTTDGQKYYHSRLVETIDKIDHLTDSLITVSDVVNPPASDKAFMLTHQPYDLTVYPRFERLDLLESNTGVLKPRALWSSKYNPMSGESFTNLPFLKKLLLVFGDRVLIKPAALVMRRQILDTALKHQWDPRTTLDRVKLTLEVDVRDPYFLSVFNSL